ncbi:MAG: hypothetical protein M3N21_01955 [Actinomycetota bacterium]|nr:hypothetical protein [Actinomycetota bacterium]
MRARIVRPALALALAATGGLALTANAAAPAKAGGMTLTYTDPKGDANAINGQSLGSASPVPPPDSVVTPVGSQDSKDILSVTYASTGTTAKKVRRGAPAFTCTGFTATMTLAGAPDATNPAVNTLYRLTSSTADGTWWLQYSGGKTTLRYANGVDATGLSTTKTVALTNPAVIAGSTITWIVTPADLATSNQKLFKFSLSGLGADVRSDTGVLTVPAWDLAAAPDATTAFKPC